MKFSASLVLAAAVGAYAYPSAHAHMKAHRSLQERDVEFVKSVRPTRAPTNGGSDDGSNGGSNGAVGTFCNGNSGTFVPPSGAKPCTASSGTAKRASAFDIGCYGNLGSATDYGCNLKQIDASDVDSYEHTITLENSSSETQSCACFLKISKAGLNNGHWRGNEVFDVTISPGDKAYVAADDDTQGSCACGAGDSTPVVTSGNEENAFAGTWLEFDFSSKKNNNWSGADASNLVASRNNMPFPAMKVTSPQCSTVSTIHANGVGINAFHEGTEEEDGRGFNQPAGPFSLKVELS